MSGKSGSFQALKKEELPDQAAYVLEGAFDRVSGNSLTKKLLRLSPRPDALFCSNALMATGALEALQEASLNCPEDLALACFDKLDVLDIIRPRLTCIAVPSYELGAQGATLLLNRLSGDGKGSWQRKTLESELLVGESSGA